MVVFAEWQLDSFGGEELDVKRSYGKVDLVGRDVREI